ncbi:MAG: hypothetical protein ACI4TU_09505 [Candidatus Cryptobacteroides sp.]
MIAVPKDGKGEMERQSRRNVVISAGSDIVSSYDWRGVRVTGAAFQPSARILLTDLTSRIVQLFRDCPGKPHIL